MSETVELELVVTEKKEGRLVTNIDKLELMVSEKLTEYTPENYKGDADAAKKDRAVLNTSKKTLTAERIKIIKELMRPFDEFETRCKKIEKDIDSAAIALDAIVKIKEDSEKEIKRLQIKQFWECQNFDLVELEKIFDQKWLNKTTKNKDVFEEIEKRIAGIYEGIKTIEAFGVEVDTLKPIYLDTLDLGKTIEQGNRIKQNRERLIKEEEERKEREALKVKLDAQKELVQEEIQEQKKEPIINLAAQAAGEVADTDPIIEYTMTFRAKKSILFALRQYMLDNGITYEKVEKNV